MTTIQATPEQEQAFFQHIRELLEPVYKPQERTQDFATLVHKRLNEWNTYNRVMEGILNNNLDDVLRSVDWNILERLRGLIYFKDHLLYQLIWKKPPTKSCLKKAIDLLYE